MKIAGLTLLALLAFAGNSVLCRLALADGAIDAASFTWIRLLSGAVFLIFMLRMQAPLHRVVSKGSWIASFLLFLYAVCFSFAYLSLATGMGALILFATVQITMIVAGWLSGNRLHFIEWIGTLVAFSGFVFLVLPGLSAPPISGFILMVIAGGAWSFYTLAGKDSRSPLGDTAYNFMRALPFAVVLLCLTVQESRLSTQGILLAALSGGITSGVGYTLWYMALNGLTAIQAAVVQLLVPVVAALGGVLFTGEVLSLRLMVASALILGGILVVIVGKHNYKPPE